MESFLKGYRRFAEYCAQIAFVRYEDFTRDPDAKLRILCERLVLDYDGGWRDRWADYTKITGDTAGHSSSEIKLPARPPLESNFINALARNADYRRSLELLGYEHPR